MIAWTQGDFAEMRRQLLGQYIESISVSDMIVNEGFMIAATDYPGPGANPIGGPPDRSRDKFL
jgi:hypothetical protein